MSVPSVPPIGWVCPEPPAAGPAVALVGGVNLRYAGPHDQRDIRLPRLAPARAVLRQIPAVTLPVDHVGEGGVPKAGRDIDRGDRHDGLLTIGLRNAAPHGRVITPQPGHVAAGAAAAEGPRRPASRDGSRAAMPASRPSGGTSVRAWSGHLIGIQEFSLVVISAKKSVPIRPISRTDLSPCRSSPRRSLPGADLPVQIPPCRSLRADPVLSPPY